MTTDTALALLAEAEDAICILSDSIRDGTVSEYYSNLRDRITALLDSGGWVNERDFVPAIGVEVITAEIKRNGDHQVFMGESSGSVIDSYSGNLVYAWQPLPPLPKGEIK